MNNPQGDVSDRLDAFGRLLAGSTVIAFVLEKLNIWFQNNEAFATGSIVLVIMNMIVGMYMHKKKGKFSWEAMLKKTVSMVIILLVSYTVLEFVAAVAGKNIVSTTFRAAVQVATLLYPGTKILKNIFILSDGEHPPAWVMKKIYNFNENGDLKEFLEKGEQTSSTDEDENL